MLVDLNYSDFSERKLDIHQLLREGKVVVIRKVPEILVFRDTILQHAETIGGKSVKDELSCFLHDKKIPRPEAIQVLTLVLKKVKKMHYLATLFADMVVACQAPEPLTIEYGSHRIVFSEKIIETLKRREDLFEETDFIKEWSDGQGATFMAAPIPPHRDIGRPHYVFQFNFWFPLHRLETNETLILFPDIYRETIPDSFPYPSSYEIVPHRFRDNPDPATWGFGDPLLVPLECGDILLFHGEVFHGSPIPPSDSFRLSYDMRIASRCHDDNRQYLDSFRNLNNFLPEKQMGASKTGFNAVARASLLFEQEKEISANILKHFEFFRGKTVAWLYSLWASQYKGMDVSFYSNIFRVFDFFPFAEDRYLALARSAWEKDTGFAKFVLNKVLSDTTSYFWALETGNMYACLGEEHLMEDAFAKARTLAGKTTISFDANPTAYNAKQAPCLEILPEHVDKIIAYLKSKPLSLKKFFSVGAILKTHPVILVEEDYYGYNIIKFGDIFYGVSSHEKQMGSLEMLELAERAQFPWVADEAPEKVRTKIEDMCLKNTIIVKSRLVEQNYNGFNILKYKGKYYAISHSLGDLDLTALDETSLAENIKNHETFIGDTLTDVKKWLNQFERKIERLTRKIGRIARGNL